MTEEIMKELWAVKEKLSEEATRDPKTFYQKLNDKALDKGFTVIPRPSQMKGAEDSVEYKAG